MLMKSELKVVRGFKLSVMVGEKCDQTNIKPISE